MGCDRNSYTLPSSIKQMRIDWDELCLGGLGAMGACLFTNPLEVIKVRIFLFNFKVRIQLQGI